MKRVNPGALRGQAMAEFAVVAPVVLMVLAAVFLIFVYAWRAFNVDWLLFATGTAAGVYGGPHAQEALGAAAWSDLREAVQVRIGDRQVGASIRMHRRASAPAGLLIEEWQRGATVFYLWRFYPGPEGKR